MVLVGTIVVDEDYPTANVNVLPQRGVANVGQVADLSARPNVGFLDLTEVTDMDVLTDFSLWP